MINSASLEMWMLTEFRPKIKIMRFLLHKWFLQSMLFLFQTPAMNIYKWTHCDQMYRY